MEDKDNLLLSCISNGEANVLKKSVKAAGFGLNHVNGEFTSSDFLDTQIEYYGLIAVPLPRTFFIPPASLIGMFLWNCRVIKTALSRFMRYLRGIPYKPETAPQL